jgi:hypothetical protein
MLIRFALLLLVVTGSACAGSGRPSASTPATPAPVDAREAWERLSALLPGSWIATTPDGGQVAIAFRPISNGSALAESFGPPGHETMTIYHPDGVALQLTHYCGQGNQATLRATSADEHRVVFTFASVTNAGPEQGVMAELIYELDPSGARALTRVESYRLPDGSTEQTRMTMRPAP